MIRRPSSVPPDYANRYPIPYYGAPPVMSRSERPDKYDGYGQRRRRRTQSGSRKIKDQIGAGLAGALAGGWAGHEAGKGDTVATVTGALLGALGAAEADKLYDKYKNRSKKEEKRWEDKWAKGERRY